MMILTVDDSMIVRRLISRQLEEMGVSEILEAQNGQKGLDLFRQHQPDLVTMDITMPGMDGLTCVSEMIDLNPAARILVISALGDEETALEAVERGANGYICKPFTAGEFSLAFNELFLSHY